LIESNDMLFQFRSDSTVNLAAVILWLQGSSNNMNGCTYSITIAVMATLASVLDLIEFT
jgi:hypothetical protein